MRPCDAQLLFRTMNRDTHEPEPCQDHLAALLRDRLMPIRSDAKPCWVRLSCMLSLLAH